MSPSDALNAIPLQKQFVAITNRTMHCLLNEWTWNFRLAGPGFRRGSNCRLSGGGQLIPPTIQSIPLGLSCVENRESYKIEIMPVTFTQAFSYPPGLILSGLQSQAIRSRYCLREAWSFYYHVSSLGRLFTITLGILSGHSVLPFTVELEGATRARARNTSNTFPARRPKDTTVLSRTSNLLQQKGKPKSQRTATGKLFTPIRDN